MTITYYTSGARSFYTVNKPIRTPADLKGLKIRVQDMKSQTDMLNALGGIPVAMAYGDVYTSLQTGIIDGTENNETALTTGKHGEICKVFSTDEHAMIPDVLVMSAKTWAAISRRTRRSSWRRLTSPPRATRLPGMRPSTRPSRRHPHRWAWSLSTMWIKRRSARRPVEWWTSTARSTRAYRVSLTSSIL